MYERKPTPLDPVHRRRGRFLSRRSVLKTGLAAGVGGSLPGLGTATPGLPGILAPNRAQAQTPTGTTIDEVRIAMAAIPPQLDPQAAGWIVMQRMYGLLYDTLIRRDWSQGGALVPGLATAWERVDEVTLELTLRDDVVFHDGTPMTAADVKYTLDRGLQGDPNLGVTGQFPIAAVEALDDHRVRIATDGVDGALELRLTTTSAAIIPAAYHQEAGFEGFRMEPIGTGPYRLTEFVPDSHLSFAVNEAYFGGVAAAQRVTVRGIPEVSTRVAALLNDELDLIVDLPADQVPTVEAAGGFTINSVAPLNVNILDVNGRQAPTDKKEIRQALSLAINREAIVEQLLGGHGLWPGSIQSELDLLYIERPPLPYDPERAKQLLADAGYAGEEIKYVLDTPNYYPLQREWSEVLVGMWSEVGLNVTLQGVDVSERVQLRADDGAHLITNSAGVEADLIIPTSYGTPDGYAQEWWYPEGSFTELNEVVARAVAAVDPEERAELYQDAIDIMNDEVIVIVLFTINRLNAMKETIQWSADPEWQIDLRPGKLVIV